MLFVIGLMLLGVAEASVGTACLADAGCDTGECCMASYSNHGGPLMKGKRQVTGLCQMMGTDTVRKQCYPNSSPYNGVYRTCPCAAGYTCKPTGFYEVPIGMIGECTKTA